MPMHIHSSVDADSSNILTLSSGTGPTANPPATKNCILEILRREQDHAASLLSSNPLLSSLFVSYANRAAALESVSTAPAPDSEERKALQVTITALREENEKLKSEHREIAGKLEVAEIYQEASHSQVSHLKGVNVTQRNDIKSLRAELFEAKVKYDQLVADSNAQKAALRAHVSDLETQWGELKATVLEQQIKMLKLECKVPGDNLSTCQPPGAWPESSTSITGPPFLPPQTPSPTIARPRGNDGSGYIPSPSMRVGPHASQPKYKYL